MDLTHNPVSNPKHYTFGKYEVIDVIDDWGLGFNLGNAIKYIARAGKKDPTKTVEDLEKALFYIRYDITRRERESEPILPKSRKDIEGA